jgi:hypothetical protein
MLFTVVASADNEIENQETELLKLRIRELELKKEILELEAKKQEKPLMQTSPTQQYVSPNNGFSPSGSSGYIRGPRGGCFTYSKSGNKRYVDRSLCN